MNPNNKSIFELDITILIVTLGLIAIGITFIFSSGITHGGVQQSTEYIRQIVFGVLGITILIVIALTNSEIIKNFSPYIFVLSLILIVVTLLFGRVVNGARAWLGIGSFGIQPSEFSKLAFILVLARYLETNAKETGTLLGIIKPFLYFFLPPLVLILQQPDLGTAMVFFPVFIVMLFFGGAKKTHLLFITSVGILSIIFSVIPIWESRIAQTDIPVLAIFNEDSVSLTFGILIGVLFLLSGFSYFILKRRVFFWISYGLIILLISFLFSFGIRSILREYQIMRLIVFLDPTVDRLGSGWHIIQSTIAIGSGGIFGKGLLQGTQSQLQYLPEQSTDFIFSILSEEWGFIGSMVVFILYGILIFRMLRIGYFSRDSFGQYVTTGIVTMFFFHFAVNIGMTIGLMPITGIPLLLISYGGSNLWMSLMSIGIILNIGLNKFHY